MLDNNDKRNKTNEEIQKPLGTKGLDVLIGTAGRRNGEKIWQNVGCLQRQ